MEEAKNAILRNIYELMQKKSHLLLAIDGRCGSGKSTTGDELVNLLHKAFPDLPPPNLIHMDHFYLQLSQRTPERLAEPGGNVDYERFLKEVMIPLKNQEPFSYYPFDHLTMGFSDECININIHPINIIEGSYSCHPMLIEYYILKVFLTIDKDEQMRRIVKRNGEERAKMFEERWIPLEEKYFKAYDVQKKCDLIFKSVYKSI